jgi:hypothetical protein
MNDAPIQIRNPEVTRAIRELAEQSGRPITEAVGDAVKEALSRRRAKREQGYQSRLAAIDAVVEKIRRLPRVGPMLTDDDFYDEDGLPK